MKQILFFLCFLFAGKVLLAQYVYTLKADSVKLTNCDSSELIIENHTQGVPGFLFNAGNGRTEFRKIEKLDDSTLVCGYDTLIIRGVGVSRHGDLTGLLEDDHPQYFLLAGRAGGQSLTGGTGSDDVLTFRATSANSADTGSKILFQVGNNGATEAMRITNEGNVGIGVIPTCKFHVRTSAAAGLLMMICDVSDAQSIDKFFLQNASSYNGSFVPRLCGQSDNQDSLPALGLAGIVDTANDTNTSRYGLVDFAALKSADLSQPQNSREPVEHRNLFSWRNDKQVLMLMDSAGGLGINTTPGAKLDVNGSVKINKDSVPLLTTIGSDHILMQDTTTGSIDRIPVSDLGMGFTTSIQTVTASSGTYAPSANVNMITYKVYASANSVSMTITAGAVGQQWNIKRMDNSANTITITPSSGTIDGQSSITISTQYGNKRLQWNGSDWMLL